MLFTNMLGALIYYFVVYQKQESRVPERASWLS